MTIEIALKHIAILALFYTFYKVFLANTTFHGTNRWVLLASILISVLPFFWIEQAGTVARYTLPEANLSLPQSTLTTSIDIPQFALIYTIGAVIALCIVLIRLGAILHLFLKSSPSKQSKVRWINSEQSPCSFLLWSFIPKGIDQDLQKKIILHESAHLKMGHSVDRLLVEVLQVIFWFNPLFYFLRRELVKVHEFQADNYSQQQLHSYSQGILEYARWKSDFPITSSINPYFVHLKNRINMLHQTPTNTLRKFFLVALLPLCASAVLITACDEPEEPVLEKNEVDVYPEFVGGMNGLIAYLTENFEYPEEEKENGTEETIYVEFTVNKDGSISDVHSIKGENENLIATAVASISGMPAWTPGTKDGKKVAVKMVLPIKCTLPSENLPSPSPQAD